MPITTPIVTLEGFIATGKTTLANMLAREFQLPRFDCDEIVGSLTQSHLWKDSNYHPVRESQKLIVMFAKSIIQTGPGLVIDCATFKDWLRPDLEHVRTSSPAFSHIAFALHVPLNMCAHRADHRRLSKPWKKLDGEAVLALQERWEAHEAYDEEDLIHVDASRPIQAIVKEVSAAIRHRIGS